MLSRVSVRRRRLEVVAHQQRLSRPAEIVHLAGFVALAGQRAFEMRDVHFSNPCARGCCALDLQRAMLDPEAVVEHLARGRAASSGSPPGATRCAVSAVSVVLSGQTWRSCTASTPVELGQPGFDLVDIDPRRNAASDIHTDSLSSPMLPHRMTDGDGEAHHRVDPALASPQDDEARRTPPPPKPPRPTPCGG